MRKIQNILHVINSPEMGGAEKLVADMLPLYNTKVTADVLYLKATPTPLLAKVQQIPNAKVLGLSGGSVYNPLLVFKLMPHLRQYDVVHVHLFPALYWVAIAKLLSFSKTKLVYTEHSTHNKRREKRLFKLLDNLIYRAYDTIFCISAQVQQALQKHLSLSVSRYAVVANGIDLSQIENATPYDTVDFFEPDDIILLQVSSFRYPKDQETVIKALPLLPEKVKLLLVGEGPLQQDCVQMAQKLGVAHRVKFLGNRMDVPQLLKTAHIVLLSSRYEGVSLSSLEGMASGRAFVASDAPGLAETVAGAGLLFETGNESSLAQILSQLLEDEALYEKTVAACQTRAQAYDLTKTVNEYLRFYQALH